jgi:hypothetical protein
MKLNRWQVSEIKSWNGPMFDPQATLKALWRQAPEKIRKSMVKLNAIYSGKSLEEQLDKLGTKYVDSLNDFYYEIIASSRRNVQLIEARYKGAVVLTSDVNVGAGGSVFELVFGENYFFDGEVIVGEKNERYPVRVLKEPVPEGDNVVYTVECWGLPNGMPGSELVAGKKFSVEYAPVEAGLSRAVGGIRRPGTARVRGTLSTIRIDHKVAGDIDDYAVLMGFPVLDKNGNEMVMNVLSSYEDWLVEQEFADYKNKLLKFGTTNVDETGEATSLGKSGRKISAGQGLRQQQDQSNVIYYNFFSLDLLESILTQLSYNKLGLNDREFVINTGQGGATLFHKAVLDTVSGWMVISQNNPQVIQKVQSELHSNAFSAGFQFTQYMAPNGIKVRLEVDDMYDDPVRNKILMPGTQQPAESFRMDIQYMGTKEEPNVQKVMLSKYRSSGGEIRGYGSGFRNPFTGEVGVNYMTSDEDSATITKFCPGLGVVVYDTERSASLIPTVLQ